MKKSAVILLFSVITTACQPVSSTSNRFIIDVAAHKVDCVGVAPMKCLQIRKEGSDKWLLHYGIIQDFTHHDGTVYRIEVEESRLPEPIPADASSLEWKLIKILDSTPP